MDKPIEDILDQCLDAVLNGADINTTIARFPGYEGELRPLLELAVRGRDALAVAVPRDSLATTKAGVMAGAREIAARRQLEQDVVSLKGRRGLFGLKPLAWIAASFLVLSSGTALAASSAGPDSFLYPVRQRLEETRTSLSWDKVGKARHEAAHASERLDEIAAMVDKGKPELVPDLVYRYELHLDAAIGYANEAAAAGEDTDEVYGMIDDLDARFTQLLDEIYDELPEAVRNQLFSGGAGGIGTTGASGGIIGSGSTRNGSQPGGNYGDDDSDYRSPSGGGEADDDAEDGGGYVPGGSAPGDGSPEGHDETPDSGDHSSDSDHTQDSADSHATPDSENPRHD